MQSLLKIAIISTVLLLVEGSLFRSSADEKSLASSSTITQENLSSILDRLETLEQKLDEQQRQIEELEKSSASSRSLQDDECGWSFVNDNGTPSCKVNYQVAAGKTYRCTFILDITHIGFTTLNLFVSFDLV